MKEPHVVLKNSKEIALYTIYSAASRSLDTSYYKMYTIFLNSKAYAHKASPLFKT